MSDQDTESSNTTGLLEELQSRAEALERRLTEVQQQAEARLIRAELKAEAIRAGIVDPDGLKLIDISALKLNDSGEFEAAAELISEFKQAKPWLFGSQRSSSSGSAAPPSSPPRQKLATEMTESEWRRARNILLGRRA